MNLPPHAMSRYAAVTENLIKKCRLDYQAGRDLGQAVPSLNQEQVTIVVAESLEADGLLRQPRARLTDMARQGAANDWSLAVLAEIHFVWAEEEKGDNTDLFVAARRDGFIDVAWTALEHTLNSPTASPMLWYQQIFFEVGQRYRNQKDDRALEFISRGLKHSLTFNQGSNAENFLRDLAETHLELDQLNAGLRLLSGLLQHNPADIWTYNLMAIRFDKYGLTRLGEQAVRRGLELLNTQDTPNKEALQQQLTNSLEEMQQAERTGREIEVDPALLAEFQAALTLPFEAGTTQPVPELCRQLVPALDSLPVKRAKSAPVLPRVAAAPRLNRNDSCWCGSGKKYKHCHMRAD